MSTISNIYTFAASPAWDPKSPSSFEGLAYLALICTLLLVLVVHAHQVVS